MKKNIYPTIIWLLLALPGLFAQSKQQTRIIDYRHLLFWRSQGLKIVLLDLRQPYEYNRGHIPGARNLPFALLNNFHGEAYRHQLLLLYSDNTKITMRAASYFGQHAYTLKGDFATWLQLGHPVSRAAAKTNSEAEFRAGSSNYQNYLRPARAINPQVSGGTPDGNYGTEAPKNYKEPGNYRDKYGRAPPTRSHLRRSANRVGISSRQIRRRNY